jgi:predicted DNA-binding protein
MKNRLSKLARVEGKTPSQMVRELIEKYIKEKNIRSYIDNLWSRIGGKLGAKGVNQKDINTAIKESRKIP